MQRKQHNPRHPTRFLGHGFFFATGGTVVVMDLGLEKMAVRWMHIIALYLHCSCRCYMDDHFQFWHLRTSKILLPGSMVPLDMEVSGNFARCVCCFFFFPVSDFTGFSWIFETTSRNSVFWRSSLANAGNLRKFQLTSIRTSMIT